MRAFLEITKIDLEDIITTSTVTPENEGLTNGGAGNAGSGTGNSGGWGEAKSSTLLD